MASRLVRQDPQDTDPYTGDVLTEIPQADADDLDEAYTTALEAHRDWAAQPPMARAQVMRDAADVMGARNDEIIDWLVRESGGTLAKAELEWSLVRSVLWEAASMPHHVEGKIMPSDIPGMTHVNDAPVNDDANTAFGGEKASGIGRFGGQWAIDEFTTEHWISVQHEPRQYAI
ncbi:aldehyde dehydrogenase family protein [Mycobacterium sp. 852014-52144_SCH5372336]|uniref:aldehyde dehydrogenase family protein n=1 Tax=Mycobacterium sp. 852014-52144_SCH5372336 TaxID=1834115 RepID=UPI0007FF6849|nr:aldehyde dehydrogenase family protein [Mycobacterium sp. 852014-52144_SCH5372336]OBB77829.1 hypothetical protein A5759_02725 [Mycobacterium sp. 852014-52144_SCH5372336]